MNTALTLGQFEYTGEEYEFDERESLITIARPGRGKSQAHVIRNLLRLEAPAIVLDVKPEIFGVTAAWRGAAVGPIQRFQPSARSESICFNPLDMVRADPIDAFEDVARLVPLLMVPRDKAGAKNFWESRAAQMLTAALYDVCINPEAQPSGQRSMGAVVDWFSSSEKQLQAIKLRLQASPVRVLRRTGDKLDSADMETLDNVMQTVLSHIEPWGWPQIEPLTGSTTLDLTTFRETNGTLYLCVTERELVTYRPIIRTLLGQILYTLREDQSRWHLPPVTFFLDEFPQLGYMQEVEQMLALGRQPGLRLWFFSQTLDQLEEAYGKADKILDMVAVRCFIAPTGSLAAKLSKELGTVIGLRDETPRPVATPQELSGPEYADKVIVLEGGRQPARLNLVMAYEDPEVNERGHFSR
jgi:type IV secretory pathway TraG/TraD family ATPase VirD4